MADKQISGGPRPSVTDSLTQPERIDTSRSHGRRSARERTRHLQNIHTEVRIDTVDRVHSSADQLKQIRTHLADSADALPSETGPEDRKEVDREARLPQPESNQKKETLQAAFREISRKPVDSSHKDIRNALSHVLRVVFPHSAEAERTRRLEAIFREAEVLVGSAAMTVAPDEVKRVSDALLSQADVQSAVIDSVSTSFSEFKRSDRFAAKALELLFSQALAGDSASAEGDALQSWLGKTEIRDVILQEVLRDILG